MNENKKMILMDIVGMLDLNSDYAKNNLICNFNDFDIKFQEYEFSFKDDPELLKEIYECHRYISDLYTTIVLNYLKEFAEKIYGQSIDFIIMNYSQENILSKLEKFLNSKGLPNQFKSELYDTLKKLAERIDKRFSFDEVTLINLIEASSGHNIILEDGRSKSQNDEVLLKTNYGYMYEKTSNSNKYTLDGSEILNPKGQQRISKENIRISSFPLGNQFSNTNNVMRKIMSVLFENLNLCIETYNSIYSSGDNVVENTALLSNGETFNFEFIVNEFNIPHLLGILPAYTLNQKAIDYLNNIVKSTKKPRRNQDLILLSQNSNALDVLFVIYANQNQIIEAGGLYEENGKFYEIINWERVILKTSSFMRGDFFKTCFCLVKLANNKWLASDKEKGGYVSISSTKYGEGLNSTVTARSVLNDLLNTKRQRRDFIFRGFITDGGKQIVNSIMTGKSETIHVGKDNELLRTLQRYRNIFLNSPSEDAKGMKQTNINGQGGMPFGDSPIDKDVLFGSIVEEIENERFIRVFTPQEQAELGLSISRDLNLVPTISKEAMDVLQSVNNQNGAVTTKELDEFESVMHNTNLKR